MYNMLLALAAGVLTTCLLYLPHLLRLGEALVPAVLVTLGVLVLRARRSYRSLQEILEASGRMLQSYPPRFEVAINILERGYKLAPWQFGMRSQVDAQIGVLYFLQKDYSRALPYLKRALMFGHWVAGAMLGVVYYKKKDLAQMRKTMQVVTRRAKKQPLAWSLHAYLLMQTGARQAAQKTLASGLKYVPENARPRLEEALLALQNGKKLKMRAYAEQWYQFHLEQPPADLRQSGAPQARMGRIARRGRWS